MKNYTLKNFFGLLAFILTITSITGMIETKDAFASEHYNIEITQGDLNKNDLQTSNEIEVIDKSTNDSSPIIQIEKEEIDLKARMQYDLNSETLNVHGSYTDDKGKLVKKQYFATVERLGREEYEAKFIDKHTGEVVTYNSLKAKSSAWPLVIVAAVAKYGIKHAIKKYGKKATQNAVKTKSFGKVLPYIAKLDANKRKHILVTKHNWHKVTKNDWNNVSKVMSHVMRHGKESTYKKSAYQKTLNMNGHTVVVTYSRKNGQIKVSNGWVR